ncbi:MAG TPA: bis(5'-nucleosyl)-tetraphosphatase (symmetrical) YqeK, partial [Candidatus Sulfotelmatobacter sp.]|nr:bis(5'-nucleosyl)-tetraphosphatase (symmetrical) YqeK [Candidatus Sulfotelmatobacter sp.]
FRHSLRVEKIALALAKKHGGSTSLVIPAALLHDCGRRFDRRGLLRQAKKLGLPIDPVSRFEPKLLHAAIGAVLARREFGVRSAAVLRAIGSHTVGAPNMGRLEKIIFLADHIEEGRRFAGVKKVRRLAFRNMDAAIIASLTGTIAHLLAKKFPVFAGTVEVRNSLILKKNK